MTNFQVAGRATLISSDRATEVHAVCHWRGGAMPWVMVILPPAVQLLSMCSDSAHNRHKMRQQCGSWLHFPSIYMYVLLSRDWNHQKSQSWLLVPTRRRVPEVNFVMSWSPAHWLVKELFQTGHNVTIVLKKNQAVCSKAAPQVSCIKSMMYTVKMVECGPF